MQQQFPTGLRERSPAACARALVAVLAVVAAVAGACSPAATGTDGTHPPSIVAPAIWTGPLLTYRSSFPETFQYPASWRIISGYWAPTPNSPFVSWAVGTGNFDLGCKVTDSGATCGQPNWTVPDDGVVVAWYSGPHNPAFSVDSPLGPSPAPGYARVNMGACPGIQPGDCLPADMLESRTGLFLYFDARKNSVLEARWGPKNADLSRAQVLALIGSWRPGPVEATPST
jgi:hypothetical protein